jgi:protein TonB
MFESFTPKRTSWARRTLFIGSIVFHGVAAVALLIYSVFHVEELAPPEVTLTFFNAPPPPPPPPPPPAQAKKTQSKPKTVVPTKITSFKEPKPQEKKEEEKKEEHSSSNDSAGQAGGVQGGVAGGVVGGVVGAPATTAAPPPPPPPPAAPKMVPSFVFAKDKIGGGDPHLPDEFKSRHPKETLNASYRVCVGTDGRVSEMSVVRGIGGVDDGIIQQVRGSWSFKPQPVPVCTIWNFVFKIN